MVKASTRQTTESDVKTVYEAWPGNPHARPSARENDSPSPSSVRAELPWNHRQCCETQISVGIHRCSGSQASSSEPGSQEGFPAQSPIPKSLGARPLGEGTRNSGQEVQAESGPHSQKSLIRKDTVT